MALKTELTPPDIIMTTLHSSSSERLSALADGELSSAAADAHFSQESTQSSALCSDWNTYHVIGQVLKGSAGSSMPLGADPAFLKRLNLRLVDEKMAISALPASSRSLIALPNQAAANEAVFRWKLVAGFTSLSAAVVVAWSFVGTPDASTALQLSQSTAVEQVVVASPQGPMVRDARLEELMAAHKQLGGSSLQALSGFLRNAGFENSQSGRR